ncbi:hypothetical protein MKD33_06360, partial [Chromobacterium piscinae]
AARWGMDLAAIHRHA